MAQEEGNRYSERFVADMYLERKQRGKNYSYLHVNEVPINYLIIRPMDKTRPTLNQLNHTFQNMFT